MNRQTLKKVVEHGTILINAFKCVDEDPIRLCRALRRLENKASEISLRCCNEGTQPGDEKKLQEILEKVIVLLNPTGLDIPIFINTDPRGYALKIDEEFMRKCDKDITFQRIPRDWGGYGLIAPDLTIKEAGK